MSFSNFVMSQKRLILITLSLLTMLGLFGLIYVPKSEDPRLPEWYATLIITLPGSDSVQMDQQIAKPVNDRLREVSELKKVDTLTQANVTIINLEMKDSVQNTEEVWNKVREAIDEIKADFPEGTLEPQLKMSTSDLETILLAVHGSEDRAVLIQEAKQIKDQLLTVPGTSKIVIHGDPVEELQVRVNSQKAELKNTNISSLTYFLQQSNSGIPAGSIEVGDRQLQLKTNSRFENTKDVAETNVPQTSGDPIKIEEIASAKIGLQETESAAFYNGKPAVFLGLIAQDPIEIVRYGILVREKIKNLSSKEIKISEVSFNPDRTEERLGDLAFNLVIGVITVGVILWFWMGWRIAFVVTLFLPIISLVGFHVYNMSGGVLHQISLAAFVISLGQFIDNIIVIVESIQRKIEEGIASSVAAQEVMEQFKKPMLFATGTNIAAFIPMAGSSGSVAEFTKAIPTIAIITLICAFVIAILAVPMVAQMTLKPQKRKSTSSNNQKNWIHYISVFVIQKPKTIIAICLSILAVSSIGFLFVKQQFFPSADRNQFVVRVDLQEGSNYLATQKTSSILEKFILNQNETHAVSSFIGENIPKFYYNVGFGDFGQNTSQMIVVTKNKKLNDSLQQKIKDFASKNILDAKVRSFNLEQGPPILAPIEYRVMSEDRELLSEAALGLESILANQKNIDFTKNDLGIGMMTAELSLNQNLGYRFNLSPQALALNLLSQSRGAEIGKVFYGSENIDLKIKSEKKLTYDELLNTYVTQSDYRVLKLRDLVTPQISFTPNTIRRYQGEQYVHVLAWPQKGTAFNEVTKVVDPLIQKESWFSRVKIEKGGEAEGSGEANMAILTTIPLGLFVLLICLLLEFNSIRRVLIIMLSVPLVISGVTPGLIIGQAAFGFMSLLGVLAVVGIVVNNSILLIESIEEEMQGGLSMDPAIQKALELRVRPILLTALTTIAGLLPMAFEDSTLWPPLALAMISGIFASTLLTLFFVPALYKILIGSDQFKWNFPKKQIVPAILAGMFIHPQISEGRIYTWKEAFIEVEKSELAQKSQLDLEAHREQQKMQSRATFAPKLGAEVTFANRLKTLTTTNAFGTAEYGKNQQTTGGLELIVPIFDPSQQFGTRQSLGKIEESFEKNHIWNLIQIKSQLSQLMLAYFKTEIAIDSLERMKSKLDLIQKETQKFYQIGQSGKSDLLQVEMAISDNKLQIVRMNQQKMTLIQQIKIFLPDVTAISSEGIENLSFEQMKNKMQASNSSNRADILSLKDLKDAQNYQIQSVRQGYLPTIEARGRWVMADQGLLDQKEWTEAMLVFKWNLFEGGVRQSQVAAEVIKMQSIQTQLITKDQQIKYEQQEAWQNYVESFQNLEETQRNLSRAREAAAEDKKNALQGKILVRQWLQSELNLEQRELDQKLSRWNLKSAETQVLSTQGEPVQ